MIEKLMQVLDILRTRCGYDCKMIYSDGMWSCMVNYIESGPQFDYCITLDHWVLKRSPQVIAGYIFGECEDAIISCDSLEV